MAIENYFKKQTEELIKSLELLSAGAKQRANNISRALSRGIRKRNDFENDFSDIVDAFSEIRNGWDGLPCGAGTISDPEDVSYEYPCCVSIDEALQIKNTIIKTLQNLANISGSSDNLDKVWINGFFADNDGYPQSDAIVEEIKDNILSAAQDIDNLISQLQTILDNEESIEIDLFYEIKDSVEAKRAALDKTENDLENLQTTIPNGFIERLDNLEDEIDRLVLLHPLKHIEGYQVKVYTDRELTESKAKISENLATYGEACRFAISSIAEIQFIDRVGGDFVAILTGFENVPSDVNTHDENDLLSSDFVVYPKYEIVANSLDIKYSIPCGILNDSGLDSADEVTHEFFTDANNFTTGRFIKLLNSKFEEKRAGGENYIHNAQNEYTYHIDNLYDLRSVIGFVDDAIEKTDKFINELKEYEFSGETGTLEVEVEPGFIDSLRDIKNSYNKLKEEYGDKIDDFLEGEGSGLGLRIAFGILVVLITGAVTFGLGAAAVAVGKAAAAGVEAATAAAAAEAGATAEAYTALGWLIGIYGGSCAAVPAIAAATVPGGGIWAIHNINEKAEEFDKVQEEITNGSKFFLKLLSDAMMKISKNDEAIPLTDVRYIEMYTSVIERVNGASGEETAGRWYGCGYEDIDQSIIGSVSGLYKLASIEDEDGTIVITWEYNVREEETTNTLTSEVKFWQKYGEESFEDENYDQEYSFNITTINKINNATEEIIDTETHESIYPSDSITMPTVEDPLVDPVSGITIASGAYWTDTSDPSETHYAPGSNVYIGDKVSQGENVNFELHYEHEIE